MTSPILIAQISDLHIKTPGALAYGKVDTVAALARCIETLNGLSPRPNLVVISGDLADTPTDEEYAHLNSQLARLTVPFVAVPGNHDDRVMMRTALPGQGFAAASGPLNTLRAVGDVDIVVADSSVPGQPYGLLDDDTLSWLDNALHASQTRPVMLFLHHPPFFTGIGHMDVQNLHNAERLAALVQRYPRVVLIAAGHVHRATLTTFAGRQATICPAPNHAVALDLDGHLPPSFVIEPPAFHLHCWSAGEGFGTIVTHTVPVGKFDGPHPFFGNDGKLL